MERVRDGNRLILCGESSEEKDKCKKVVRAGAVWIYIKSSVDQDSIRSIV
jgi:hypothetical protein